MYKTSIVKILKNLSKTELRELGRFVQSPYFNSRPEVVQLYDALSQSLDAPPSVYEKEKLFTIIAPKSKVYDDAQMRQWIHQLLKVIKAYFVQKEIEENKTEHHLLLAKAFRKRGMDDFFEKEIENTAVSNKEQPFRHADFHFKNYLIELEKIELLTMTKRQEIPYNAIMSSLTDFFITEILRLGSVTLSYQATSQKVFESPFLKTVLNFLNKNDHLFQHKDVSEGNVLKMYYHIFQTMESGDEGSFNQLVGLLKNNWQELPELECRTIYSLALNFCTKKINSGKGEYLEHYFDLNDSGFKNRRLLENGIISKFHYKNAVSAAIKLKNYTWTRQFIEDYKAFLHPKDREATYSYNLAVYYSSLNEFEKAQRLLQNVDLGDLQTNLAGRSLLLRIYYETKAFDALESLLDSFQIFIQRQKELFYQKDNYLNLIKITRIMLKNDLSDFSKRNELKQQVEATPNIALKDWLLEKLA